MMIDGRGYGMSLGVWRVEKVESEVNLWGEGDALGVGEAGFGFIGAIKAGSRLRGSDFMLRTVRVARFIR